MALTSNYAEPSGNTTSEGFAATDTIHVTSPSGISTVGQDSAQAGFDAAAHQPMQPDLQANEPHGLAT